MHRYLIDVFWKINGECVSQRKRNIINLLISFLLYYDDYAIMFAFTKRAELLNNISSTILVDTYVFSIMKYIARLSGKEISDSRDLFYPRE